jgi:hypothetical protein
VYVAATRLRWSDAGPPPVSINVDEPRGQARIERKSQYRRPNVPAAPNAPAPGIREELLAAYEAARHTCLEAAECTEGHASAARSPGLTLLLRETVDLLTLTIQAVSRGSDLSRPLSSACATACQQVADQCASWSHDARLGPCIAPCQVCVTTARGAVRAWQAAYPRWSERSV